MSEPEVGVTPEKHRGLARFFYATRYSIQGLCATFRNEPAFRYELFGVVVFLPLAFWVGDTALETAFLIATLILILITEVINSAIESVVDRMGSERHVLAGRAKDQGSAAVFLALILAAFVWGALLIG